MLLTLGIRLTEGGGKSVGGAPPLPLYQDRCTRIGITETYIPTQEDMNRNSVVRFVGSPAGRIQFGPPISQAVKGSRIVVFNHDRVPITVAGSTSVSVEFQREKVTTAPYFEIVVTTRDSNSAYKNVAIIASE